MKLNFTDLNIILESVCVMEVDLELKIKNLESNEVKSKKTKEKIRTKKNKLISVVELKEKIIDLIVEC